MLRPRRFVCGVSLLAILAAGCGDPTGSSSPEAPYDHDASVTALAVTPGDLLLAPGGSLDLEVTATWADGNQAVLDPSRVAWVVDPPHLASVEPSTGVLVGAEEGVGRLYAAYGGATSPGIPVAVRVVYNVTATGSDGGAPTVRRGALVEVTLRFDVGILDADRKVDVSAPPLTPWGEATEWGAQDSATWSAWFVAGPGIATGTFPIDVQVDGTAPEGDVPQITVQDASIPELVGCSQVNLEAGGWSDPKAQPYVVTLSSGPEALHLEFWGDTNGPMALFWFGQSGEWLGNTPLPQGDAVELAFDFATDAGDAGKFGLVVSTAPNGTSDQTVDWQLQCTGSRDASFPSGNEVDYDEAAGFSGEERLVDGGVLQAEATFAAGASAPIERLFVYLDLESGDPGPVEARLRGPAGAAEVALRSVGHAEPRTTVLLGTTVHPPDAGAGALDAWNGQAPEGTWTLDVVDGGTGPTVLHGFRVFADTTP